MTPAEPPLYDLEWGPSAAATINQTPARLPVDFSPPLIAMVVVVATAFLVITYFRLIYRHLLRPILNLIKRWRRRWRRWRHRHSYDPSAGDIESITSNAVFESTTTTTASAAFHFLSPPYGLDEMVIKTIPLSVYTTTKGSNGSKKWSYDAARDCAVCLLEFEDNDYVRTLPVCAHAFHVDCIDMWLRSHANCPLCRAGIFRPESPFVPMMAGRIRPSLDERILENLFLEPVSGRVPESEIGPSVEESSVSVISPRRNESEDRYTYNYPGGRDPLLKRSYSFGFERNFATDRLLLEPTTASPWRYRRASFWRKSRVFSFRQYRGMKSPFFRRRSGFFPFSESSLRFAGGGGSSRRSKSSPSPMFMRTSVGNGVGFSSSRLRCGDPEALLSPERFNRR
ncbi:RING-H2 finger protein ATL65 isoform X2 [Telopea speciosissima]|uniref:RING-H2 finger protein ATL65 isoform X2 n=1 Tax=Telopea speciosissima TaxID=54955 RepID=UPI001CC37C95|nr:RING-H2 finger protein ATL65 isoform X2 [Telopea speciosissima]